MHTLNAKRLVLAATAAAMLAGCSQLLSATGDNNQGWAGEAQDRWASATQGSRLMPLAWFRALARPDSEAAFADDAYLASFRIVPQPGKLPVGFAIDDSSDKELGVSKLRWFDGQRDKEKWVGLNCAACHTAVIEYDGKEHRVDGGPSLFDFQSFIEALDKALHQTLDSASVPEGPGRARFDAFARKVLCEDAANCRDTPTNRQKLQGALAKLVVWEDRVETMNKTSVRYGFGRVDAFGHIFNKISLFNQAENPTRNPASAPVSYPFLWDIYRHDKLQWNGIAARASIPLGPGKQLDYGALGRNTGEVIGVFGDIVVAPNPGIKGYKSSVQAVNLERIERLLMSLKAPKWPQGLGAAGGDVAAGKALFGAHCQGCHAPQPGNAPYKVTLVPLKRGNPNNTDMWMACNAIRYTSPTGNLAGLPESYIGNGPRYTAQPAQVASMLATTVKGALVGQKGEILLQAGRVFLGAGGLPRVVTEEIPTETNPILEACLDANSPLMQYKARPLDGIWATAPYLHNGSIPSLYQLLLAPDQRVKRFFVGTRRFDPDNVGYQTDAAEPGNRFEFDTSLPGNSNAGHDYGASQFTEADRRALIAYLKTL